ncbi:Acyl-CoA dehydrogenase [Diplonema papillatum]|nr:Acyl-CoA dehydrogenase [Diplonema papillatum]
MEKEPVPFGLDFKRATPFGHSEERDRLSAVTRQWVEAEVVPRIDQWEEEGMLPRDLHVSAAKAGFYGIGIPKELGGSGYADVYTRLAVADQLIRCGSLGLQASLMTSGIGLPPIIRWGSEAMKRRVVPPVARGEKIICLCITEPWGGSDVAQLRSTAVPSEKDPGSLIVNGNKTFITSGCRADYFTVAVRTGGKGATGISLILLERGMQGITTTPLKKMGWLCSDTAMVAMENVVVPRANVIGKLNGGFSQIMMNFNWERLSMASSSVAASRVCLEEMITYAKERKAFGKRLSQYQGIRWKIMDVAQEVESAQAFVDNCAWCVQQSESTGKSPDTLLVARLSLLKRKCTMTFEKAAREACQVLGGKSYLRTGRGCKVERLYREVRVMAIGGGSEEIMLELASRQARL